MHLVNLLGQILPGHISIFVSLSFLLSFLMCLPHLSLQLPLYGHPSHPLLSEISAHGMDGEPCQELQNPTAFPIPPGWIRPLC